MYYICCSTDNTWMQSCFSKLIAGAGNVGCAKYTGIGRKEGNIGVVTKDNQICKWVSSLHLSVLFCMDVLLTPWLLMCGDLKCWLECRTVIDDIRSIILILIFLFF